MSKITAETWSVPYYTAAPVTTAENRLCVKTQIMNRDKLSKPAGGRYFPYTASELISQIVELGFSVHQYDERLPLLLENCDVECPLGYQLCSFMRRGYFAQFSLPVEVAHERAQRALDAALIHFREIDAGPELAVRDQQFVVHRAYLGPLGALSIAQHIVSGGYRAYLRSRAASQLSKAHSDPNSQTTCMQVTIN